MPYLAFAVDDLGTVVSIAGGVGAGIGALVLPGVAYIILAPTPRFAPTRVCAAATALAGLALMPLIVVQNMSS